MDKEISHFILRKETDEIAQKQDNLGSDNATEFIAAILKSSAKAQKPETPFISIYKDICKENFILEWKY